MNGLEMAREEINLLDKELASLFERRMNASLKIAKYKMEHGLPIYDKGREEAILAKASELIESKEISEYFVLLQRQIMALSKSYQSRLINGMRVSYSGTEGAFAHIALKKLFESAIACPYQSFEQAYRAVSEGECDAVVLPIENSFNGEVGQVSDLIFSGPLFVNAMMSLSVSQDLIALPGTNIEDIKTVISHPQALGQCADFIKKHGLKTREYDNTALAAKYVLEKNDRTLAAIASKEAAKIFGLQVVESNINSQSTNTTRFAVLSRTPVKRSESAKDVHSIIVFTVRNEAGALAKAIDVIGKHGFNMRVLRSRPMKELLWQYYFYVEAEGNVDSENGEKMMEELSLYCDRLKLAGSFSNG